MIYSQSFNCYSWGMGTNKNGEEMYQNFIKIRIKDNEKKRKQ